MEEAAELTPRQRDYLHLTAFILAQHGQFGRADTLMAAIELDTEDDPAIILSRAVLSFYMKDYARALAGFEKMDVIDPIERFGQYELNETQKLRRYFKARCYRELGEDEKMRDAVDIYLRRPRREH